MIILGIETSCDETAVSVIEMPSTICSNIIYSQSDMHAIRKGVMPELAARLHVQHLLPIVDEAIQKSGFNWEKIDGIAAAKGPGLIGSLLIGMNCAKTLALTLKKPFISVNHIEAHLYIAMMGHEIPQGTGLGIVLSGGHTLFCLIRSIGDYVYLGKTCDDAIGEAFDKVGIMLGLPYPCGPLVEKLAKKGISTRFTFRAGEVGNFDVSYSGIKTAVLYKIKELCSEKPLSENDRADIASSFQKAAFQAIFSRIESICFKYDISFISVGGGVTANYYFREALLRRWENQKNVFLPSKDLSTDNAVMIAGLGGWLLKNKGASSCTEKADPSLRLPIEFLQKDK